MVMRWQVVENCHIFRLNLSIFIDNYPYIVKLYMCFKHLLLITDELALIYANDLYISLF